MNIGLLIKSVLRFSKNYLKRRQLPYEELRSGDIFIDCGANTGQETIPALNAGAIVYAFEPHPQAFAVLRKNVGRNRNAHLLNQGVCDRTTTLKLYLHANHEADAVFWSQGASFVREKANIDPSKFVEVKLIDLAQFIEKLDRRVKILKIDIEGLEFDVLARFIKRETYKRVDYIFVETHVNKIRQLMPKEAAIKKLIAQKNIQNIYLDWI